jgi:hypothetical protein
MTGTQFSLRTLLAAVAVVGIGAGLWIAEPSWQVGTIEVLLLAWVPASLVVLACNSTGRTKAWWIPGEVRPHERPELASTSGDAFTWSQAGAVSAPRRA